uniref:Uncharacterized protein n=1 Tax=Pyrodinium bahamense TaxID=73915 RepID=A0A7S0FZ41_9DINO|mmetsp:Transcript_9209/g.25747  ORF Transcript_9209/g.25747 Transcript_9209/m.25747 type:complete len:181 (+) Transcript_9209:85-627(+)
MGGVLSDDEDLDSAGEESDAPDAPWVKETTGTCIFNRSSLNQASPSSRGPSRKSDSSSSTAPSPGEATSNSAFNVEQASSSLGPPSPISLLDGSVACQRYAESADSEPGSHSSTSEALADVDSLREKLRRNSAALAIAELDVLLQALEENALVLAHVRDALLAVPPSPWSVAEEQSCTLE